jgi:hypothetical protein
VADSVSDQKPGRKILFEGFSAEKLLSLPDEELDAWAFTGEPLAFRVGSASILGELRRQNNRLVIELAQIDEGGEGVLVALAALAKRYSANRGLRGVEWIVHAIDCAKPNLKLRRVLQRRGFVVEQIGGVGRGVSPCR